MVPCLRQGGGAKQIGYAPHSNSTCISAVSIQHKDHDNHAFSNLEINIVLCKLM